MGGRGAKSKVTETGSDREDEKKGPTQRTTIKYQGPDNSIHPCMISISPMAASATILVVMTTDDAMSSDYYFPKWI